MAQTQPQEHVFDFAGGRLCLDFSNTLGGSRAQPREYLHHYQDLVSWGRQAGVLTEREARRLGQEARRRPEDAARMLEQAKALREALFRIFQAASGDRIPAPDDLDTLNAALREAHRHLRLEAVAPRHEQQAATPRHEEPEADASGFEWRWTGDDTALDRMLWPVARSAAGVLMGSERAWIHVCEGPTCDWLFLDMSRNHSRRWCVMKDCGNRAKARRYYARHKAKA